MSEVVVHSGVGQRVWRLLNPLAMLRNLWRHRDLTLQLARRDIVGRYRNSSLGLLWSVITPLVLLVIYTFVFAVVFKARWGDDAGETKGMFALTMFCGMLVFNFFAEVVNRAPNMIVDNANYVKKVVFPLEVFVVSAMLTALFTMVIGFGVWLVGWTVIMWSVPPWTVVLLPVVMIPVVLTTAGVAWVLASVGVFVRDVGHAVLLITQVLFFATPVFYSIKRVPEPFQIIMKINPLTHAVEAARRVMMGDVYLGKIGQPAGTPAMTAGQWNDWLVTLGACAVLALLGYAFFMKSKRAFADVL